MAEPGSAEQPLSRWQAQAEDPGPAQERPGRAELPQGEQATLPEFGPVEQPSLRWRVQAEGSEPAQERPGVRTRRPEVTPGPEPEVPVRAYRVMRTDLSVVEVRPEPFSAPVLPRELSEPTECSEGPERLAAEQKERSARKVESVPGA